MNLFLFIIFFWAVCALLKPTKEVSAFSTTATLPLRGLLALGIVLHHISIGVDVAIHGGNVLLLQFLFWGAPIVMIFFFMSGYGLMISLKNKGSAYLDGFLKYRLVKVAFPFLFSSVVYSLIWSTIGTVKYDDWHGLWPYLPNAWFCVTLLLYYICFFLIARKVLSPKGIFYGLCIFSLAYIIFMKHMGVGSWCFQSVLAFNAGTLVVLKESEIRCFIRRQRTFAIVSSMLLVLLFSYLSTLVSIPALCWNLPVGRMLLGLVLGVCVYVLLVCRPIRNNAVLTFLGKYSYEIYLTHGAIISFMFGFAYTYIAKWWWLMTLVVVILTLFCSIILKKIEQVFMNKIA